MAPAKFSEIRETMQIRSLLMIAILANTTKAHNYPNSLCHSNSIVNLHAHGEGAAPAALSASYFQIRCYLQHLL